MNSENYYNSINDMPLANWMKCVGGDLTACRINGVGDALSDDQAWDDVFDSYLSQMGLDKTYARLLEVMKKKAEIQCDLVTTEDKFNLTLLEIEERKLIDMTKVSKSGSGSNIEQSLVHISKWVGSWLNPKQISVKEYFVLLNEIEKYNKLNS
jgi:hypothetical protein